MSGPILNPPLTSEADQSAYAETMEDVAAACWQGGARAARFVRAPLPKGSSPTVSSLGETTALWAQTITTDVLHLRFVAQSSVSIRLLLVDANQH